MTPKTRPAFWWLLGGVVFAYLIVATRKVKTLPPSFVALPPVDRLTAGQLRDALPPHGRQYFDAIQLGAASQGISPVLIAALMKVESDYGLTLSPSGPTGTGDGGHGRGLMQIDDRTHGAFLRELMPDGSPKWKNADENIKYAAKVYKTAHDYFLRKPEAGATVEVQAGKPTNRKGVPAGVYPDPRPLRPEEARLAAIAAYNAGSFPVLQALAAGVPADTVTVSAVQGGVRVPYLARVVAATTSLLSRVS